MIDRSLKSQLLATARQAVLPKLQKQICNSFHELYYNLDRETWRNTFWQGVPIKKCPLDLWIYQEILFETRPDVIIECGTADGGSALFLASMCDLIGNGLVITVDVMYLEERKDLLGDRYRPAHERIAYLQGSSTSRSIINEVKEHIKNGNRVMVVLDSFHRKEHVLKELRLYHPLVTKGCYLIVEDTNINGHPVLSEFGPGPMEALEEFLQENKDFEIDEKRHKLMLTFNPRGFLKRIN